MNEQIDSIVEIFTGYSNHLYNFQVVVGNPKSDLGGSLATNDWSMRSFYDAGVRINWYLQERLQAKEYAIRNGVLFNKDAESLCRPLFPEQMHLFRRGLTEGRVIQVEERIEENPLLYEVAANRFAKQLMSQKYDSDSEKDYKIKIRKLTEAMLTGKFDLFHRRWR